MEYKPAGEVLGSAKLVPLPDSAMVVDAVVLIKAMDADGDVGWYTRFTEDLSTVEAVGALTVACDLERRRALSIYEPEDD
jgi:hypothetical protein